MSEYDTKCLRSPELGQKIWKSKHHQKAFNTNIDLIENGYYDTTVFSLWTLVKRSFFQLFFTYLFIYFLSLFVQLSNQLPRNTVFISFQIEPNITNNK